MTTHWLRAWTELDFAACCTPDVQYEDPLARDPLYGIEALDGHARRLREAVPDLKIEPVGRPLVDGEHGCIPWRFAGTHRETNRYLALHGLHYVELSDEHIRRARGFFDLYDAAVQLGMLPQRGGVGESVLLMLRGFGLRVS